MKKYLGLFVTSAALAALSCTAFADEEYPVIPANDNIAVEVSSVEGDLASGYAWNLNVENKSDKEVLVSVSNTALNGLALYTDSSSTLRLAAGETGTLTLGWDADTFEKVEMTGDVTAVQFTISAFETESYEDYIHEDIVYYPNGEEAFTPYIRTAKDTDEVILSSDGVTLSFIGQDTSDDWYALSLGFYAANESDSKMYISSEDWTANGAECDPYFSVMLDPHTSTYTNIQWSSYMLQDANITDIENVACNVKLMNWDSWDDLATAGFSYSTDGTVSTAPAEPAEPAEPVQAIEVDPEGTVRSTGAEGKTWADIFAQ